MDPLNVYKGHTAIVEVRCCFSFPSLSTLD